MWRFFSGAAPLSATHTRHTHVTRQCPMFYLVPVFGCLLRKLAHNKVYSGCITSSSVVRVGHCYALRKRAIWNSSPAHVLGLRRYVGKGFSSPSAYGSAPSRSHLGLTGQISDSAFHCYTFCSHYQVLLFIFHWSFTGFLQVIHPAQGVPLLAEVKVLWLSLVERRLI